MIQIRPYHYSPILLALSANPGSLVWQDRPFNIGFASLGPRRSLLGLAPTSDPLNEV